jgi:hypothetical protein
MDRDQKIRLGQAGKIRLVTLPPLGKCAQARSSSNRVTPSALVSSEITL